MEEEYSVMPEEERNERTMKSRAFTHGFEEEFLSDQDLKRPQPPLTKAAVSDVRIRLSKKFDELDLESDYVKLLFKRRSHRVYTGGKVDLPMLSFLLWSVQGVKGIRGKKYATLRTVPSGGARHPFETYLYVKAVDGLEPGLYHYLPMEHEIELLKAVDPEDPSVCEKVTDSLQGQDWALLANVVFFFSLVPYRGEWRYGFDAHRVMMIDAGHVTENLYLSCGALGLGTCAIAAVDAKTGSDLFGLDGTEEYMFYAAPVGTVSEKNEDAEQEFYAFLKEE